VSPRPRSSTSPAAVADVPRAFRASPADVARFGLEAAFAGRGTVMCGLANRIAVQAMRLLPKSCAAALAGAARAPVKPPRA
jgi:hypothetical protein